jgi:predicted porin
MKKSLLALALFGAFAGVAQAQSSVIIYGVMDAGMQKRSDTTMAIGKRANNVLGFKGTEDIGNGLKALFQAEIRFEPDTGTIESITRPLFQGQSRVGLQSNDFGMIRFGRGLTAFQESSTAFDPFKGLPTFSGFQTDLTVAGYTSDPLSPAGNSTNRFSNAFFWNSPEWNGFQVNTTIGTKEANNGPALIGRGTAAAPQYPANAEASASPYSISTTYKHSQAGLMFAYERNAVETKLWSIAGSVNPIAALKLTASYQSQDQSHSKLTLVKTKSWVLGANYMVGASRFLAGYGQKNPEGVAKTKQFSLGYEYSLSKRTYLYVDGTSKKAATSVTFYQAGVNHSF